MTDYQNNDSDQLMKRLCSTAHPVDKNGGEPMSRSIDKSKVSEELPDKPKSLKLVEILNPQQCRVVTMPNNSIGPAGKVAKLLYTNSGIGLLALGSNSVQRIWKWSCNEQNPSGKATTSAMPQHWQPKNGRLMTNDISYTNPEDAVPCIALSNNDSYVMSACGWKISLFTMTTFEILVRYIPLPPGPTFLAFHPQDNNIIAIGMGNSNIKIYNVRTYEKSTLKGHQKHITGLAFSSNHSILVSSGADAQLCVWNTNTWEKKISVAIQLPAGKTPVGDTQVQFNSDQSHLLVIHETQLAIYDAAKVDLIYQWVPQDVLSAPVSCASYSCDSQYIYASFSDGDIGVFDADNLRLRCRIASSAYLSPAVVNSNPSVYPLALATHPQKPNQLAVGLTDGAVIVIEPADFDGNWGAAVPISNGRTSKL